MGVSCQLDDNAKVFAESTRGPIRIGRRQAKQDHPVAKPAFIVFAVAVGDAVAVFEQGIDEQLLGQLDLCPRNRARLTLVRFEQSTRVCAGTEAVARVDGAAILGDRKIIGGIFHQLVRVDAFQNCLDNIVSENVVDALVEFHMLLSFALFALDFRANFIRAQKSLCLDHTCLFECHRFFLLCSVMSLLSHIPF